MKKAIAMKCTQENWDSIKGRIPEEMIYEYFENTLIWGYLTNNFNNDKKIAFTIRDNGYEREIHKTFNAKIFLEACGIDYEPTFTITKETVIKYNMKDEFPEVFKMELVAGFWYKSETKHGLFKNMFKTDDGINIYGFTNGAWFESDDIYEVTKRNLSEATPQEVEAALICEAKKRYPIGSIIKLIAGKIDDISEKLNGEFFIEDNCVMAENMPDNYFTVFKDGIWATIIQPEKMTLEQIEKELGRKIELI